MYLTFIYLYPLHGRSIFGNDKNPRRSGQKARMDNRKYETLQYLVNNLSKNINNRVHTATILLDVKKVFSRVWHDHLIYKMLLSKIPSTHQLIESIFANRFFRVRIENHSSSLIPIVVDVPQGFCLVPILYLIFTNDIPIHVNSNISLFADNTMFYL